jgi:hypothetical protein
MKWFDSVVEALRPGIAAVGVIALGLAWGTMEAHAGAFVRADVGAGNDFYSDGNLFGPAAGPVVHATAGGNDVTGGASWGPGGLPPCDFCAIAVSPPQASSRAEANGTTGSLRAHAFATTAPDSSIAVSASGIARLTDTLTFTNPSDTKIGYHLDLNGIPDNLDPNIGGANVSFEFGVIFTNAIPGSEPEFLKIFTLFISGVEFDGGPEVVEAYWHPFNQATPGQILNSSDTIFSTYGREIDISEWLEFFETDELDFYAHLRTDANCDVGDDPCTAFANVGNTSYIITNALSAEGYSYVGPLLVAVPAPASGLVLLSGLAFGLALRRRRR